MIRPRMADWRAMRTLLRLLVLACALSALAPAAAMAQAGGAARCAVPVDVPGNDHVGPASLPKGTYRVLVLDTGRLSCNKAVVEFRGLLKQAGTTAPTPWVVDAKTKTFSNGAGGPSFRVERVATAA